MGFEVPFAQVVKDVRQHDGLIRNRLDHEFLYEVFAELQSYSGFSGTEGKVVIFIDSNVVGGILIDLRFAEVEVALVVSAGAHDGSVGADETNGGIGDELQGVFVFNGARERELDTWLFEVVDVVNASVVASVVVSVVSVAASFPQAQSITIDAAKAAIIL